MSDMQNERGLVEARREGWCAAARDLCDDGDISVKLRDAMIAHAPTRWPLPKVTRPRVETDQYGDQWKYELGGDGDECAFYWRSPHNPTGDWTRADKLDAAIVPTIARLIANPTEEVDDA